MSSFGEKALSIALNVMDFIADDLVTLRCFGVTTFSNSIIEEKSSLEDDSINKKIDEENGYDSNSSLLFSDLNLDDEELDESDEEDEIDDMYKIVSIPFDMSGQGPQPVKESSASSQMYSAYRKALKKPLEEKNKSESQPEIIRDIET